MSSSTSPVTEVAAQAPTKWVVPFIVTLLAMLTLQMASLGFAPLMPQIVHEFKFSYTQLGLFAGAYGILALALSVPAGLAIHRFNEKRVLFTGLVVVCLGLAGFSLAVGTYSAFAARIFWLCGYRFAFISVLAALAFTCPTAWRGRSFGILGAMSSLGVIIGAPTSGFIGRSFGWRSGMVTFACITAVATVLFLIFYRRDKNAVRASTHGSTLELDSETLARLAKKNPFRMPRIWLLVLVLGMSGIPSFGITFFVPSMARTVYHMDSVAVGWMISSSYILAVITNLLVGFVMDRVDKWVAVSIVTALIVPSVLLMNVPSAMAMRLGTMFVIALSFTVTNQAYGFGGDALPGPQTANVMGMIGLGAGVFGYVGPQILGVLRDFSGSFAAGWIFIATIAFLGAVGFLILRKVDWDSPVLRRAVRS